MKPMVFKIISRDKETGRQIKKRTYTSIKSFMKYGADVINRYSKSYDVETYQLNGENWIRLEGLNYIEEPQDLTLCTEDLINIQMTLDEVRDYLNAEVHPRCDYDIYSYLIDKLDVVERVFDV